MSEPRHRIISANEVRIHLVEQGEGPLVLLVHGFPESWYSWRHLLPVLADAGFRAAAMDVRGYGRSSKPAAIEAYRMMAHVADNLGVVTALDEETAVVVGHDWGAAIAATSALLRPDVFRAVGLLSVAYTPPGGTRPTGVCRQMGGDEEFYINYLQQPGRAEAEIETDVRSWLFGIYLAASGDARPAPDGGSIFTVPPGGRMRDRFVIPDTLPTWLGQADLDAYVDQFEQTGFTGGLNRYRNIDRDWEDMTIWDGRPIEVPAVFIGGEHDAATVWGASAITRFDQTLPALWGSHILAGCGHWTQQERPADVAELLLGFLRSLG